MVDSVTKDVLQTWKKTKAFMRHDQPKGETCKKNRIEYTQVGKTHYMQTGNFPLGF